MKVNLRILYVTGFIGIFTLPFLYHCRNAGKAGSAENRSWKQEATYVGRNLCRECHELQYQLFTGSDHDLAMAEASSESVLGNFDSTEFKHLGITSRFYRKGELYYVFTEGPEGIMQEYQISYTFGVRPLQQYLIEFPGGAYQCLPIAWDTRPAEAGGQRWFHLYGNERIAPDDILYWTHTSQNWNYMCSECHSTNTQKRFDYPTKTYHTTWSEIDVSCEACHGPGSIHIDWAEKVAEGAGPEIYPDMGLVVRLKDGDNATWVFDPGSKTARRSVPRKSDELVQMCARCHSRRSVTTEEYYHGGSLLDTHWPSLLEEDLYFPDGQIEDEVYVYGSFLQSRMYEAGVVCKDCHEPHSGKVYVNGNALCFRCHLASEYGGRSHHFHNPSREGASCVDCHMPERTYMVIDPRRDHSIRIPRPDLSDKLGSPNACNQCHTDKSTSWATHYLVEWYGQDLLDSTHYGEVFWAARQSYPEALEGLIALAINRKTPLMVRANAIALLSNYNDPSIPGVILETLRDENPLVRYASLTVTQFIPDPAILNMVFESLNDSVRLVRIMAANILSAIEMDNIPESRKRLYMERLDEYHSSLMINADHPGTHVNFGNLYLNEGDMEKAEQSYKEAIELEPGLLAAYINLTDLYRRQGRDSEGEQLMMSALEKYPELATVHYSLGLLKIRLQDTEGAMEHLKKAAELSPEVARFSYVHAIGLNSTGKPDEALKILYSALAVHPYDRDILYAIVTINTEQGHLEDAASYAKKLVEYYPTDEESRNLLNFLTQE